MAENLARQNTLRKEVLGIGDAIAQSIAVLALLMAIALSTSFAAQFAGAAAPLAYVVAGLGSLCLAYVIIRFTRRMASAGGVYTYISQSLGPGAGFIGGWMYSGAFAIGIAFTLAISSIYASNVLANFHITVDWFVIFCALLVALFLFAFFDIRVSTRTQLVLTALGVVAILILVVLILAKGGNSGLSLTPFSPAALSGGLSGLFFATIFGFTSFIGFEAAAVFGEETARPRSAIPQAILISILVAAVFFILVTYAFSVGYGVAHANKWAMDQSPLDTLATRYGNSVLATIIDIMVAIDAFVASLAGLNLVARTLYAMGRDRGLPPVFGWTHPRYKSPWVGIVTGLLLTLVLGATLGRSLGPFLLFGFLATTGSLGILFAYILVAISGMAYFLRSRQGDTSMLIVVADVLLPVIAVLLCGATIYSTIVPAPPPPLNYAPYIAAVWLLLGLILLAILWFTSREQVRRFGQILAE